MPRAVGSVAAVGVGSVCHAHDGDDVTLEVDPIEDPVGAAPRVVPVLERGASLLPTRCGFRNSGPMISSQAANATDSGSRSVSWRRAVGEMISS